MSESTAEPRRSPATLHVIAHIRWEREGQETFEVSRARLLDTLAGLLERMSVDSRPHFLLGGQTVLLEDVAAVRPDLLALLVIYNASGRLSLGPWYVQVDEALVSGEALIRNLLTARADARQHGVNLMPVAYVPDSGGHIAQLPQIMRGFNIDAGYLAHGAPVPHLPFRWEGPDGSSMLVINHAAHQESMADTLAAQQEVDPDGPYLWVTDDSAQTGFVPIPDLSTLISHLPVYVRALRRAFPDNMRPALKGELRFQGLRDHAYLFPGTLSSRLYLKQTNARLQARLTYAVEPWLTLALTHGQVAYPDNLRALLAYSWRLLLKNQARNALGGCSADAVHAENEIRYRQIEDTSAQVVEGAMRALPGQLLNSGEQANTKQTFVVVWNPHNWRVTQVTEAAVRLPPGCHPARLTSPAGEEQLFGWLQTNAHEGILSFLADVPPVGYATYTLELGNQAPSEHHLSSIASGNVIGNVSGETLLVEDSRLTWNRGDARLTDLLRFYDGGDAGDAYNYSPPDPDVIVQAWLEGDVKVETAALYERLILRHRLRVAPTLRVDRGRDRGVKLIELTTTATFYDGMTGIYFHTEFENTVKDHRLRAHLHTGIQSSTMLAGSAFGLTERNAVIDGPAIPEGANREGVINTHPMHDICAVQGNGTVLALLARGLPEVEAVPEDAQTTLALTLLRAVGWLGRHDLRTRTALAGGMIATPDAQCERVVSAEYMLRAFPTADNPAELLRAGQEFSAPLQARQYRQPPDIRQHSYLSAEHPGIIMTALKPPQIGAGWIVRLLNPTDQTVEMPVKPHGRPRSAHLLTLAEDTLQELQLEEGQAMVELQPHKIVTLRFGFE